MEATIYFGPGKKAVRFPCDIEENAAIFKDLDGGLKPEVFLVYEERAWVLYDRFDSSGTVSLEIDIKGDEPEHEGEVKLNLLRPEMFFRRLSADDIKVSLVGREKPVVEAILDVTEDLTEAIGFLRDCKLIEVTKQHSKRRSNKTVAVQISAPQGCIDGLVNQLGANYHEGSGPLFGGDIDLYMVMVKESSQYKPNPAHVVLTTKALLGDESVASIVAYPKGKKPELPYGDFIRRVVRLSKKEFKFFEGKKSKSLGAFHISGTPICQEKDKETYHESEMSKLMEFPGILIGETLYMLSEKSFNAVDRFYETFVAGLGVAKVMRPNSDKYLVFSRHDENGEYIKSLNLDDLRREGQCQAALGDIHYINTLSDNMSYVMKD